MYCRNCGTELKDGQNFCPNCGAPVDKQADEQITYKNIKGLDKYPDLEERLGEFEETLESYKQKQSRTKWEDMRVSLRLALEKYIIKEYINAYPECDTGTLDEWINSLYSNKIINQATYELFDSIRYRGNAGNHKDWEPESYNRILKDYKALLNFLPEFLKEFPEPGVHDPQYGYRMNQQNSFSQSQGKRDGYNYESQRYSEERASESDDDNTGCSIICGIFLLFVLIIIIFVSCANSNTSKDTTVEQEEQSKNNINQETFENDQNETEEKHYAIGETWTVEGQWEFTVDKVTSAPLAYDEGAQVITIDYHYTNIGDESEKGLYMPISSYASMNGGTQLIDADGIVCRSLDFPLVDDDINPEYATIGATWAARESFEAYSNNNSATLIYKGMDSNGETQTAVFDLNWLSKLSLVLSLC